MSLPNEVELWTWTRECIPKPDDATTTMDVRVKRMRGRTCVQRSDKAQYQSFQHLSTDPHNPFIRQVIIHMVLMTTNSSKPHHQPISQAPHMLNLADANTLMRLAINASTPQLTNPSENTKPISPDNVPTKPQTAPLLSPRLQFGPIWVREAQRTAASSPTSPTDPKVPQSSPIGTAPLKEIFCQPPTPEMHRDSLRHAFLSLFSSF
jgi:hypothetical protein